MSTGISKSISNPRLSVKAQAVYAAAAVACAVALPQIFHILGAMSGLGSALGETFLPMHLPIILVGLLAGPYAGAIAGALSPLISHALSGMPGDAILPFMMIELCSYGLFAGLLRNGGMPAIGKVLTVQIAGRAVRAAAIIFAFYVIGSTAVPVSIIWTSIKTGICGIVLQWVLLPLIIYRVEGNGRNEG